MSRKKNEETKVNVPNSNQTFSIPKDTLFCIKRNKDGSYIVVMDPEISGVDFFSVLGIMEAIIDEYNKSVQKPERYPLLN